MSICSEEPFILVSSFISVCGNIRVCAKGLLCPRDAWICWCCCTPWQLLKIVIYQFQLLSSWADAYYVGLNGIELYDSSGNLLVLNEASKALDFLCRCSSYTKLSNFLSSNQCSVVLYFLWDKLQVVSFFCQNFGGLVLVSTSAHFFVCYPMTFKIRIKWWIVDHQFNEQLWIIWYFTSMYSRCCNVAQVFQYVMTWVNEYDDYYEV